MTPHTPVPPTALERSERFSGFGLEWGSHRVGATTRPVAGLVVAVCVAVSLGIAAASLVYQTYEVVGTASFTSASGEPVPRIELVDRFDVFVEPAYAPTRAALSAFFLTGIAFTCLALAVGLYRLSEDQWTVGARFFLLGAFGAVWLAADEFFALRLTLAHNIPALSSLPFLGERAQAVTLAYLLVGLAFALRFRSIWTTSRTTLVFVTGSVGCAVLGTFLGPSPALSIPMTTLAWGLAVTAVLRVGANELTLAATLPEESQGRSRRGPVIGIRRWGSPPPSARTRHSPWRT